MFDSVWILTSLEDDAKNLSAELGIPPEMAQILVNRRITEPQIAHEFLFGTLDNLHDPYMMRGMKEAVGRVKIAISRGEKILIFGDYDVDGVLSVVILTKALESLGGRVDYFIPNRLKEGYGIKEKYIDLAVERKASLVISVDCGIKANAFVKRARMRGIDVIITDHHLPGSELPNALAILNPVLPNSGYPDGRLAGIGVVFKLIQALFEEEERSLLLSPYLKMVSIATIADVAELRGENRLFVRFGLKDLESVSNRGLACLLDVCGLSGRSVSVGDVGFRIGPRINAAGRMGMADLAVELFFSESPQRVEELVCHLDTLNSKRQKIEERIYEQALSLIRKRDLDKRYKLLIMGCEEWHRGVIGIVASKIKDVYHRPVIIFSYEDGKAHGSGRSIREFSLIECLDGCKELFLNYGGHTLAGGCQVEREKMLSLKKAVNEFADSRLTEDDLKRKIYIDAKIDFTGINIPFIEKYSLLSPFGIGNPRPFFLTEQAEILSEPKRLQGKHLKFLVRQNGKIFEALGWGRGDWAEFFRRGNRIDLVYSFHFSQYLGEQKFSLSIEDIKF